MSAKIDDLRWDEKATHVRWKCLDGTVAHHRYEAILDMIRRGYTDEQIARHFDDVDYDSMIAYRKAVAGTLSEGSFRWSRTIYDLEGVDK